MSHPLGFRPNGPQPNLSITTTGKPIPPEKLPKAVRLYGQLRLAEGLAQREPASAGYLDVPNRSPSAVSHPSSRPRSSSGSTTGGRESVLSFGNEGPQSVTGDANGGLVAFDGTPVKQPRKRSRLSPKAKAKSALIRHLESCSVCRSRRVPCPLDHHDMTTLHNEWLKERGRLNTPQLSIQRASRSHSQSAPPPMQSSSFTPTHTPRYFSDGQIPLAFSAPPQHDPLLLGLDQNIDPIQPFSEITSPDSGDFLAEGLPDSNYDFGVLDQLGLSTNPAPLYQNGSMFLIGAHRQYMWRCQHDNGRCPNVFDTPNALERHFESTHFQYNRLEHPLRFFCSACQMLTGFLDEPCQSCGTLGLIEPQLYGNTIPMPSFPRVSPDGPGPFVRNTASSPVFSWTTNNEQGMNPNMGHGTMFQGDMNPGNYQYQNNNAYRNNGAGGNNTQSPTPQSRGYQYRGNNANDLPATRPLNIQYWQMKAAQTFRHHKVFLLAVALLFILMFAVETRHWLITKTRTFHVQSNLPSIGFAGMWISFAVCHKYWSIAMKCVGPGKKGRNVRCRFNDFTTISLRYRQSMPATYMRSAILL